MYKLVQIGYTTNEVIEMGVKIGAKKEAQDACSRHKAIYMELAKKYIKRAGVEKVLQYLEKEDFFTAPASTKYHGSVRGGLCAHSLAVFNHIKKASTMYFGTDWTSDNPDEELFTDRETLAIVALFHDVCKVNFYTQEVKWRKDDNGKWENYVSYAVLPEVEPWGHGEKSVVRLLKLGFMLTDDEITAISWHLGGYDDRAHAYIGNRTLYEAKRQCPLLIVLTMADEASSYIDGV